MTELELLFKKICNKLKSKNFFSISTLSYLLGEVVSKGFLFLIIPFYINLLSKEDFGYLSLFLASIPVISVLIDFAQRVSVKRFFLSFPNQTFSFIFHISFSCIFIYLLFQTVYFLSKDSLTIINKEFDKFLFINAFLFAIIEILLSYLQISNRSKTYNVLFTFKTSVPHLFTLLAFIIYSPNPIYFAYLQLLVLLGMVIYIVYRALMKPNKIKINFSYLKYSFSFSIPVIPGILSALFLNFSDRFMIEYFFSTKEVAEYSVAYTISSIFSVFFLALNKGWQPFILEKLKDNRLDEIRRNFRIYLAVIIVVLVILILGRNLFIVLFSNQSYLVISDIIPTLLFGMFFYFLYTVFSNIAFYHKKMVLFSAPTIFAAILNIILNYFMIPMYGYKVAALTTLISYFIQFVLVFIISNMYFGINLFSYGQKKSRSF